MLGFGRLGAGRWTVACPMPRSIFRPRNSDLAAGTEARQEGRRRRPAARSRRVESAGVAAGVSLGPLPNSARGRPASLSTSRARGVEGPVRPPLADPAGSGRATRGGRRSLRGGRRDWPFTACTRGTFAAMLPAASGNPGICILRIRWLRSSPTPGAGCRIRPGRSHTREGGLHAGLVSQTRREDRDRRSDRRDGGEAGVTAKCAWASRPPGRLRSSARRSILASSPGAPIV